MVRQSHTVKVKAQQSLAASLFGTSYYYDGINWTDLNPASPPAIPLGTMLNLAVWWVNLSNVNVRGHIDLTITRPDGLSFKPTMRDNQDRAATPNNGWAVVSQGLVMDMPGIWRATEVLSMEAA